MEKRSRHLTPGRWIEVAFWGCLAVSAFALTFQFDQELEIYKFGAYGWPRAVIGLIALTLMGQIYHDLRFSEVPDTAVEAETSTEEADSGSRGGYYLRMVATLGLPLLFALLLQPVGFYVLTPFFIAAFLWVAGERRWQWILGVSAGLYVFLVIGFVKIFYVGLPVGTIQVFYDVSNVILGIIR